MSSLSSSITGQGGFAMDINDGRRRRSRVVRGLSMLLGLLVAAQGGEAGQSGSIDVAGADAVQAPVRRKESRMWMTVGERRFAVTLTDNAAARAFAAQLPLTLDMGRAQWQREARPSAETVGRDSESTGNNPQWRSYAVRHKHLGCLLFNVPVIVLVHPPRSRGRPRRFSPGAPSARHPSRIFQGLALD